MASVTDTSNLEYTRRLIRLQNKGWKRFVDVQAPYRWNVRRLQPGFVLEIGCGIGRNLLHLGGNGVGVDHNPHSIQVCRVRGLNALTSDEFPYSEFAGDARFDSLLLSHVAEHMSRPEVTALLSQYLPYLKPDGKIILITPQEAGYKSDASHVEFMDHGKLDEILASIGYTVSKAYSFPFPRPIGGLFLYNEFITVGQRQQR